MIEVKDIYAAWQDAMDNKSDPRTRGWLMMSSPLPSVAMSMAYIFIVKILGPRIMENRKAINIEKIQLVYNTLHLLINFYIFIAGGAISWFVGYSYRCQPVDFSDHGVPLKIATLCWWYYFSKFTDFFETMIFVLGKRYDLVNFYHVAHHSIMPVSVWWGVKFLAGGHATFFGFLNTFVHIVIYIYLVLVGAFPSVKKYFGWWRSFLPIFQVVQFAMIFIHAFQLVWKNDCNFPMEFVYFIGGHGALFYFILMYELKWSKSKSKDSLEAVESNEQTSKQSSAMNPISPTNLGTKNFDIVFNYDSFVKILSSRKSKKV